MEFGLPLIVVLNLCTAAIGIVQYRDYREKRKFHIRTIPDRRCRDAVPGPVLRDVKDVMTGGVH